MKRIHIKFLFRGIIIFPILFSFLNIACQKGVLDKLPLDVVPDPIVWTDQKLIDAYLTGGYINTTVFTNESVEIQRSSSPFFTMFYVNNVSDESKSTSNFSGNAYQFKTNGLTISGGLMEWWEAPYKVIRAMNDIIERLPKTEFDKSYIDQRVAEARFLRAFNYFYMVKRYGGIPLVTRVQNLNESSEELMVPRSKEKDIYDFVIKEALEISKILPESYSDSDWGRPSKYAALSLVSRAALYAGSIAKYGQIQLDGVLGIPPSEAQKYYQQSLDASKSIIASKKFKLFNDDSDKASNFRKLFLTKRNSEVIFAKQHDGSDKDIGGAGWSYDYFQCPYPNGWANGIHDAPYKEFVESFEYTDGRPGTINKEFLAGKLWTIDELWKGKDPRFFATVYTQDTKWQGRNLNFYNGVRTDEGELLTTGSYKGTLANGDQKSTQTGFGVLKYLDETKNNGDGSTSGIFGSKTDYIIFRYGEILLNATEAAYELGQGSSALEYINEVRKRAGITTLNELNDEKIRNERKVELAFEGHRYWDLRRWRIAEEFLSKNLSGIRYVLDHKTKKFEVSIRANTDGTVRPPVFEKYNYYFPITLTRTASNPKLVENPGYK